MLKLYHIIKKDVAGANERMHRFHATDNCESNQQLQEQVANKNSICRWLETPAPPPSIKTYVGYYYSQEQRRIKCKSFSTAKCQVQTLYMTIHSWSPINRQDQLTTPELAIWRTRSSPQSDFQV